MLKAIYIPCKVLVISPFLAKHLAKRLKIEDDKDTEKKYVNEWHKWIENSFYSIFILFFVVFDNVPMWVMLITFCLCFQGFRTFMEWKYYCLPILFCSNY